MESNDDIYGEHFGQQQPLTQIANFFNRIFHDPVPPYTDEEIMSEPLPTHKANTIAMDVLRTRNPLMKIQHKLEMEKILNHFCRLNRIEYKQGLNQILAPFIFFRGAGLSIGKCYALFKSFFDQYCLNFYFDKEFNSLQIIFKMITVVIKYHDPALARYLQTYEIQPQIYCISWLMTLFSSKLSLRLTYILWQFMAIERDDFLIFFCIIAIIILRREQIIQTKNSSIFTVITDLIFRTDEELINTLKIALLLRKNTPASLVLFFKQHSIFRERRNFQKIAAILKQIDTVNVFIVDSKQVSLNQHFKIGLCDKHCYFCSLRQPLKLPICSSLIQQHFPTLSKLITLSNDIRRMDYSIEFIVLDIRKDKTLTLPHIDGIQVFIIDIQQPIQTVQHQFNDTFLELRGMEHFLFLLSEFTFQKADEFQSEEMLFCRKLIKILNSYSYPYLSLLEGGQTAYMLFLRDLRMKSQVLNSKLIPVSEVADCHEEQQTASFLDTTHILSMTEIMLIQKLYDHKQLHIFTGRDSSSQMYLFVLPGLILWVQKNKHLQKLINTLIQHHIIIRYLIDQKYVLSVIFRIKHMHSIYRIDKMTVRLHHNHCLVFYLHQALTQDSKNYRVGEQQAVWSRKLQAMVREDMQMLDQKQQIIRVGFDFQSLQVAKEVTNLLKQNYKQAVRIKKRIQLENERRGQLNHNVIQDLDFSRRQVRDILFQ